MNDEALAFYASAGRFTSLDETIETTSQIGEIVDIVQGLLVYDMVAEPFYGVTLPPAQAEAIHERDTARLVELARTIDARPIQAAREPGDRVGARCHAFSRVTVALLRAAGIPARGRCGFAAYFRPGWLEDHWIAEYWCEDDRRWRMVDAQLDEIWREKISFAGDRFDLAPAEFVTAGHAWRAWRRGELDAGRCGLSAIDEHGAHWIAGNLRLDLASLNKIEMLPWDEWGEVCAIGEQPTEAQLDLFDAVAELTVDPDTRFDELRECYETDARLRVDGTVFNVARNAIETVVPVRGSA